MRAAQRVAGRHRRVHYVRPSDESSDPAATARHRRLLRVAAVVAVVVVASFVGAFSWYQSLPLFTLENAPARFDRRTGDLTANVTGVTSRSFSYFGSSLSYRLNGGAWTEVPQVAPRTQEPDFTIELPAAELREGDNDLELRAQSWGGVSQQESVGFAYDPSPIRLPMHVDWAEAEPVADDGRWEAVVDPELDVARLRPAIGHRRVLVVAGAFGGGRRVETDVVYRGRLDREEPFGFGVMALWGGRPDDGESRLRGGWAFGRAGYDSPQRGVGNEVGYRNGGSPDRWVRQYRGLSLLPGRRYQVVVEAWPVEERGRHVRWQQRMKWWTFGDPEPASWMELDDDATVDLPAGEYAVALSSHFAQCDFGPVTVTALERSAAEGPAATGNPPEPD